MAFLPLLEVSSDLNCYPKAVSSHLEQESHSQEGPLLGTVAKTGKIAAIAKVRELFVQTNNFITFLFAGLQPGRDQFDHQ